MTPHCESSRGGTHGEAEVVLVFVVHSVGEVLVAGLRKSVFFVQDVQHADHLRLHQVCGGRGGRLVNGS